MRKFNLLLISLILCIRMAYAQTAITPVGEGTQASPYQIISLENLYWISEQSNLAEGNNTFSGKYFEQTANIDASATSIWDGGNGWKPIAHTSDVAKAFQGIYDGKNFNILNLYINRQSENNVGLFGHIGSTGIIKNLGVINVDFVGNYRVGGLIGENRGDVTNCYSTGEVNGGNSSIGGLIGAFWGTGGKIVKDCYSHANVISKASGGGLIGVASFNTTKGTIENSYATGNVTGEAVVGGFIGNTSLEIKNCYSTGDVTILYSYDSVLRDHAAKGGFVGWAAPEKISNSYSTGKLTGYDGNIIITKGFVGWNDKGTSMDLGTFENCFWDTDTSEASSSEGYTGITGKTTAEMKQEATFTGWDFTDIWANSPVITYDGRPVLRWSDNYGIEPTDDNIDRIANLVWLSEDPSRGSGKSYTQTADLFFSAVDIKSWNGGKGWTPIARLNYFSANFNGNNKAIYGLYINRPNEDYNGLFGRQSGNLTNINLNDVEITSRDYTAGIAGNTMSSNIQDCSVSGTITGRNYTGGLIGAFSSSVIMRCNSSATVSGSENIGGLTGTLSNASMEDSYATGIVTGTTSVGGLIGKTEGNTSYNVVVNCYSTGDVTGTGEIGGFIGHSANGWIRKSYSTGNVEGAFNVGGFVGLNFRDIKNSYSLGNVIRKAGSTASTIGGFVGQHSDLTILNSYSIGSVAAFDGDALTNNGFVGGVDEGGSPIFTACFWDTENSGQTTSTGTATGLETSVMQTYATFSNAGWDFKGESVNGTDYIWNIGNGRNDGYPYLDWQYPSDDATLPVTLSSFTVTFNASNTVSIFWTTQSESNMVGYHILRAESNELKDAVRLTNNIIKSSNQAVETRYSIIDESTEEDTEYFYWIQSVEYSGTSEFFGPVSVKTNRIDEENPVIPLVTQLNSAYPNPFNPSTSISFDLAEKAGVNIEIFNIKGQKVKSLINEEISAGRHSVVWNGQDENHKKVSSGVYFYKMQAGKYIKINKMIMMK